MHSKRLALLSMAVLFSVFTQGCGLLGKRDDYKKLIELAPESLGCLNRLGEEFTNFIEGTVTEEQWDKTWDCAANSATLFADLVRPSDPRGYTQTDLQLFVSNFLITDKPVSSDLVKYAFLLKRSLLGGEDTILNTTEIKNFVNLIIEFKKATRILIPHFAARAQSPTPEKMSALAATFKESGEILAKALSASVHVPYQMQSLEALVQEISKLYGIKIPEPTARLLFAIKALAAGGTNQVIEGDQWANTTKVASDFMGTLMALSAVDISTSIASGASAAPNGGGIFFTQMMERLRAAFDPVFLVQTGKISLTRFDDIIDNVPPDWIVVKPALLKEAIRPLVKTVLSSAYPDAVNATALNRGMTSIRAWNRAKTVLFEIFDRYDLLPSGVSKERFFTAADDYKTPETKEEVDLLKKLVTIYPATIVGDDAQVTFKVGIKYSLHFLDQTLWIHFLAKHLIGVYSTVPTKDNLRLGDMKHFFDDFEKIAFDLKFFDYTALELYKKRFEEADLFTLISDGNGLVSLDEMSVYGHYLLSISALSDRVRKDIEPICTCRTSDPINPIKPECQGYGLDAPDDPLGWDWMNMECFRSEFFSKLPLFWDHFPDALNYYQKNSSSKQMKMQSSLEQSARRYGLSQRPISSYDVIRYGGIMHYVESILFRFDKNHSQNLKTEEVLSAFPVYRRSIAEIAKIDYDDKKTLEAIFAYLVDKGKKPKDNFWGQVEFIYYMLTKSFWDIDADRIDILKLTSIFNEPEPLPPPTHP